MNMYKAALAALATVVLASACATPGPMNRNMPLAARDKIAATEVVTTIAQNEITIAVPTTAGASAGAAASFGLLGALVGSLVEAGIDASNAAAAETSVKPLRNALVDLNFDDMIQTDLKVALAQAAWLNSGDSRVVKEITPANLEKVLKDSKASAMLLVPASYELNFNADELTITIAPRVLPKTSDLQALLPEKFDPKASQVTNTNDLYRNYFSFRTAIPKATNNRDANIALWAANSGAPMREALKLGSAKLTQMLAADLVTDPAAAFDPKTTKLQPFEAELIWGHVVAKDDVGTQVALASGGQIYVTHVALAPLAQAPPQPKEKKDNPRWR